MFNTQIGTEYHTNENLKLPMALSWNFPQKGLSPKLDINHPQYVGLNLTEYSNGQVKSLMMNNWGDDW